MLKTCKPQSTLLILLILISFFYVTYQAPILEINRNQKTIPETAEATPSTTVTWNPPYGQLPTKAQSFNFIRINVTMVADKFEGFELRWTYNDVYFYVGGTYYRVFNGTEFTASGSKPMHLFQRVGAIRCGSKRQIQKH